MQIWMEIVGTYPERVGQYLICPINTCTINNYPKYRVMEELDEGDLVFHYILQRASQKPAALTSFSRVASKFYISRKQDPLCTYPPPYRKVDLSHNLPLSVPITLAMLKPHRSELEKLSSEAGFTRTPFDKNFRIKQLYLARIPYGYMELLSHISKTKLFLESKA